MAPKSKKARPNNDKVNDKSREPLESTTFLEAPQPGANKQLNLQLFEEFIRKIQNEARETFGEISVLITGGVVPDPPFGAVVPAGNQHARARAIAKAQDEEAAKTLARRPEEIKKMLSSILTKIDYSFLTHIENDLAPGGAREQMLAGNVAGTMANLRTWYERRMGLLPLVAGVTDNKLVDDAKENFHTFHQNYDESMEDFIRRFMSNVELLNRTTGQVLTDSQKAYQLIRKLNRSLHGKNMDSLEEGEQHQLRFLAQTPGAARNPFFGYPQTYADAVLLVTSWEVRAAESKKKSGDRRQREQEKSTAEETGVSYKALSGGGKSGKKDFKKGAKAKEKVKLTAEQRLALPIGTKASAYGYGECKNDHAAGESKDHFSHHCPLNKPAGISRVAIPAPLAATSAAPVVIDYEKLANMVAAQISREAFSLAGISRMMMSSVMPNNRVLLDSCGSDNEACSQK